MNKLQISLSPQEVRIVANLLNYTLMSKDVNDLKKHDVNYMLILSALYEFYGKVNAKKEEIEAFGYTPGKEIRLTMSRTQALAFFLLTNPGEYEESGLPALPEGTMSLINGLVAEVHKKFLT